MQYEESYEKLLYHYEVLRTRLKIREHYLGTIVREVYENIGQMLSLIRVRLSLLRQEYEAGTNETIDSSGEMVGQTINDLRNMCRLFYPEEEIISGAGLYKVIGEEVKTSFPGANYVVDEEILATNVLLGEKGLIIFGILLEIVTRIKKQQESGIDSVAVKQAGNTIVFTIGYHGEINWEKNKKNVVDGFDLSLFDRAELVGGSIQIKTKRDEDRRVKFEVPIN